MWNNDENDPIQEYKSSSIFSKKRDIIGESKNVFTVKENTKYDKSSKLNYSNKNRTDENISDEQKKINFFNKIVNSYVKFVTVVFFLFFAISYYLPFEDSRNNTETRVTNERCTDEYDEIYDNLSYAYLNEINFQNNGNSKGSIKTLYGYTNYDKAIKCDYESEDARFGIKVSTFDLTYESIPENYLIVYDCVLYSYGYKIVGEFEGDKVYAKNETDTNSFLFVVVGKTRIIYGVGEGNYSRIFK